MLAEVGFLLVVLYFIFTQRFFACYSHACSLQVNLEMTLYKSKWQAKIGSYKKAIEKIEAKRDSISTTLNVFFGSRSVNNLWNPGHIAAHVLVIPPPPPLGDSLVMLPL